MFPLLPRDPTEGVAVAVISPPSGEWGNGLSVMVVLLAGWLCLHCGAAEGAATRGTPRVRARASGPGPTLSPTWVLAPTTSRRPLSWICEIIWRTFSPVDITITGGFMDTAALCSRGSRPSS